VARHAGRAAQVEGAEEIVEQLEVVESEDEEKPGDQVDEDLVDRKWRLKYGCAPEEFRIEDILDRVVGTPGMAFYKKESASPYYYTVKWKGSAQTTIEPIESFHRTKQGR
jgi:hypothetical protein